MDMKRDEEFKIELEESTKEEEDKKINIHLEQHSTLEEIRERKCHGSIDLKSEIEVKEEPFDTEEEEPGNDELSDKIYELGQNQSFFINAAEGEEDSQAKSTPRSSSHWAVMHQEINKNHHLEKLSCGYCTFTCKTENELKTHLKKHRKIKFKCPHCSYQSTFKSYLERHHLVTHSNTKLFKCSHCSFECNHEGNLRRHILTHANMKLFKCSDCSYECNLKGNLKEHMLTHANVIFKCSDCSYECNGKSNLEIHMLTHTNSKRKCTSISRSHRAVLHQQYIKKNYVENLSCGFCKFSCKSKDELKTHLKKHGKIKYKCTHCSYECNLKSNLKSHLLTHCNTKLFKCSHCSYECKWNTNLKRHMLTHANISPVEGVVGMLMN